MWERYPPRQKANRRGAAFAHVAGREASRDEVRMSEVTLCEVCGNDYDKAFVVVMNGETHVFDSFECAIQLLAPTCEHCGCRVIGHGVESRGFIFCCAHCAEAVGVTDLQDRVG
jgi:hypothetical protein